MGSTQLFQNKEKGEVLRNLVVDSHLKGFVRKQFCGNCFLFFGGGGGGRRNSTAGGIEGGEEDYHDGGCQE